MSKLPKVNEVYRHHTGRHYEVTAIAREDDTETDYVIHRGLHDNRVWARTVDNFTDDKNGFPRFVLIE